MSKSQQRSTRENLSSSRRAPEVQDDETKQMQARKRVTQTLSRNLQKPSLTMHTKFVASTNPPRPDPPEKVRKRARSTQDEGQDERRKIQSASGQLKSYAIKADDGQAIVVPRTGSGIEPNHLQTKKV